MDREVDVFSETSTLEMSDTDRTDVINQLNGDVYIQLKDTAKRYILLRLDSLLTKGQPYYNHSVITVEHALPQTPKEGSEWLEKFEQPEEYVHKLGNLVLLTRSKNSQAKNYDVQKKKLSYFQSSSAVTSFALTSQVVQLHDWTPSVVDNRQKQLVQLLVRAWNLDKRTTSSTEDELLYIETYKGIFASGHPTNQGFLVMEGAKFSLELSSSISSRYVDLRNMLIEQQLLVEQGNYLILKQDYVFSSPSTASSLLLGRNSNGLTDWKLLNGTVLKKLIDE